MNFLHISMQLLPCKIKIEQQVHKKVKKMVKNIKFLPVYTPGDLDLVRVNLRPMPGRYVDRYTYTD